MIDRRTLLLTAAALPFSAHAQAGAFGPAMDAARALDQLHSLSIAQDGEVQEEAAFRGPPLDARINVQSVSKSLLSALVGVAISRGHLPGVEAELGDVAPQLIPGNADPTVGGITIGQLLSMRTGLESTSGSNYGQWVSSRDWVEFALSRPLVAEPGTRMIYSTGNSHVLGAVLSEATGRSLHDLAIDWLAEPLGIEIPTWLTDPQGRYFGGNSMQLAPRDMLRFAEMYRRHGRHNDRAVVPSDWVEASWTPQARSDVSGDAYGYGWFLTRLAGHEVADARGYGGQMIFIVPSVALTVVVTSDSSRPARDPGHLGDLQDLMSRHVIPAAEARR